LKERMHMNITTIVNEKKRGCGFRKQGGTYLVTDASELKGCGKLPLELTVCPCCGQGVKPARSWTWVNGKLLFANVACTRVNVDKPGLSGPCITSRCILDEPPEKMGLLWTGEKYYATPADFLKEGAAQGFSRRISMIPKDFVLGETWVCFAHRKAIKCAECNGMGMFYRETGDPSLEEVSEFECEACHGAGSKPGIFFMFKPQRIEYIVKDDDNEETLERKEKRGFTLVKLVRTDDDLDEEDDGQPSEQQENEDFAHDTDEYNRDASEVL
jgi:hypothetical protein